MPDQTPGQGAPEAAIVADRLAGAVTRAADALAGTRLRAWASIAGLLALFVIAAAFVPHSASGTRAAVYGAAFASLGLALVAARGTDRPFAALVVFLTALSLARIIALLAGVTNLSGDEAHYWEWSRRLDISYYSKPPGVAYLIRLGTALFGDTELGVRAASVALIFLAGLAMYKLAVRIYDSATGALAAGLMQVIPLTAMFGVGITPDAPLIFFWTIALLALYRAWQSGSPWAWLALALALGMGLLGKHAVLFFYLPATFFLLASQTGRKRLRSPWPYASFALSLAFLLPVVVWNERHGWLMFKHDLGHAKVANGAVISLASLGDFLASQLGVITPVVFVLMIIALVRRRREDALAFWLSVPILAGFSIKSLQGKVQANWALAGYISAVPLFAYVYLRRFAALGPAMRRLVAVGVCIPVIAAPVILWPGVLPALGAPAAIDPTRRLNGWDALGREVSRAEATMLGSHFVFSDNYMVSSELAFYVEGHPTTYCVNLGRRMNQYDVWPGFEGLVGWDAVYVSSRDMPASLAASFESVESRPFVIRDSKGREMRRYEICLCHTFKGLKVKAPSEF